MRLFKRSMGLPPHRYVIGRRVEKAKGLLSAGDAPLWRVAETCGFAHQQHLSTHFKRLVGVSPGRYRNLLGTR
jgi:AraC family transcriptional regulator